ncbi:MAG: PSD1 domain-containing protein [Planctomycetaceae bacterium]|nr:PSD1 domain-containing protein [Planctomycetaceae bacterium]
MKCHGPVTREGGLDLSRPVSILAGGDSGPVLIKGKLDESLIWERVVSGEMPPETPLDDEARQKLQHWLEAGALGLPDQVEPEDLIHWSFRKLKKTSKILTDVSAEGKLTSEDSNLNPLDQLLLPQLRAADLEFSPEADIPTLLRRVSLTLTGLPPTWDEQERFLKSQDPEVYSQIVEHYLNSPHYGERWGKFWLDAAGYADSNGYFNADTPRPLAYRYRDYVVRAFNQDKPFDQFVREQIAGDELSGFAEGKTVTPEMIELLEATHYLRNAQDGTDSSDGNPDELRTDRYSALEGTMQIVSTSLLGLTIQCAKCHSHKFEPITQDEYYQFQSFFYPAFNVEEWQKPATRVIEAALPNELAAWEERKQTEETEIALLEEDFRDWFRENRPRGEVLFYDDFEGSNLDLKTRWSDTAPDDDVPGSSLPIKIGEPDQSPSFYSQNGQLLIDATQAAAEDSWNSTQDVFEWAPENTGEWIQVTFDLVNDRLSPDATPALRIGYGIALHDYNDNSVVEGGNIVFEGALPGGGAAVYYDLPGTDSTPLKKVGNQEYQPGHNYGLRLTRLSADEVQVQHLVDGVPEGDQIELKPDQLPAGGFGFVYYNNRSFIVDNVLIEKSPSYSSDYDQLWKAFQDEETKRRTELDQQVKACQASIGEKPGQIAWVADYSGNAPDVHLLERGNHTTPGHTVTPAPFSVLREDTEFIEESSETEAPPFDVVAPNDQSTGRRTAWANWVTQPDSHAQSLMARVQVNRFWQHYFGKGIVATTDNLGMSGSPPSHPELLDYLAAYLVEHDWHVKELHRLILHSRAFKQSSLHNETTHLIDPANKLYWRFSRQRLNAEAVRDAMLQVAGVLDESMQGPYIPSIRTPSGETVVAETEPGARRRSIYLFQRRTQIPSMLQVFDAPKIVFNCTRRNVSTTPLQSLALMNSDFIRARSVELAKEVLERPAVESQIDFAFKRVYSREPSADEIELFRQFLDQQQALYTESESPLLQAWTDCCQMLLASSEFLYIQ